jgi:hypothetical protein
MGIPVTLSGISSREIDTSRGITYISYYFGLVEMLPMAIKPPIYRVDKKKSPTSIFNISKTVHYN